MDYSKDCNNQNRNTDNSRYYQALIILVVSFVAVSIGACGAPFKIASTLPAVPTTTSASPTELPPTTTAANTQMVAGTQITVTLFDPDQIYDTFGANLALAGVLPVQLTINNQARTTFEFRPAQCKLRLLARRQPVKLLTPEQALSRLIKYYQIKTYNLYFYEQMANRFASHSLTATGVLPGTTVQGVLYFATTEAAHGGQLQLAVPAAAPPLVFSLP